MADEGGVEKNENLSEEKDATGKEITRVKRPICGRCTRPKKVCLCEAIPDKPLDISTTVYILQHPEERHRSLRTVPILSACLPKDKVIVYNDVCYSQEKYPRLHKNLKSPETLVLYPDGNATDLREVVKESNVSQKYNLVVPDGTWPQAKQIFKGNDALQKARKVQLKENIKSHYVIRTQPTRNSLSTMEAIAVALSILEGRDEIIEILRRPLQLLCDIQLQHGAVPHSSKEEKKEQELLQLELKKKMKEEGTECQGEKEEIKELARHQNKNIENEEQNEDGDLKEKQDQTKRRQNPIKENENEAEQTRKRSRLEK